MLLAPPTIVPSSRIVRPVIASAGAGVTQEGVAPGPFDWSIVLLSPFVKNAVVSAADW